MEQDHGRFCIRTIDTQKAQQQPDGYTDERSSFINTSVLSNTIAPKNDDVKFDDGIINDNVFVYDGHVLEEIEDVNTISLYSDNNMSLNNRWT